MPSSSSSLRCCLPALCWLLRRFTWKAKLTICKIHVKISEKYISFLRKQSFSHRIRLAALLFGCSSSSKKFSHAKGLGCEGDGDGDGDVCAGVCVCAGVGGTFICSMPSNKNVASACCCCCFVEVDVVVVVAAAAVEWMKASTRRRLHHDDAKSNLECFCLRLPGKVSGLLY